MKQNLQIVIFYMVLVFVTNVYSQNISQELSFSSLEEEKFSLDQLKSKIVVVIIWNPEYPDQLKTLQDIENKYKNDSIVFLAITDGDARINSIAFLENNKSNYRNMIEGEGERIFNEHQKGMFKVFPIYIIINPSGKIAYKKKGTVKNIAKKLTKRIDALLINSQSEEIHKPKHLYTIND